MLLATGVADEGGAVVGEGAELPTHGAEALGAEALMPDAFVAQSVAKAVREGEGVGEYEDEGEAVAYAEGMISPAQLSEAGPRTRLAVAEKLASGERK